jgi:hypothetical protein
MSPGDATVKPYHPRMSPSRCDCQTLPPKEVSQQMWLSNLTTKGCRPEFWANLMNKFKASIFWKRHFWICPAASLRRKDSGKLLCMHVHDFHWIIMKARLAAFPSPVCNERFHWPPSDLVASDGIMLGVYLRYLNGVSGEMRYLRWIGMEHIVICAILHTFLEADKGFSWRIWKKQQDVITFLLI